jgi:hypothetical protein
MGRFTKGGPATISTVKPSGTVKVWSASLYSAEWISTAGKKKWNAPTYLHRWNFIMPSVLIFLSANT